MCKIRVSDAVTKVHKEYKTHDLVLEFSRGRELEVTVEEVREWVYCDGQPYNQEYEINLAGDDRTVYKIYKLFGMYNLIIQNDLDADKKLAWKLLEMINE